MYSIVIKCNNKTFLPVYTYFPLKNKYMFFSVKLGFLPKIMIQLDYYFHAVQHVDSVNDASINFHIWTFFKHPNLLSLFFLCFYFSLEGKPTWKPMNALYQVWLILAQKFLRQNWENTGSENFRLQIARVCMGISV